MPCIIPASGNPAPARRLRLLLRLLPAVLLALNPAMASDAAAQVRVTAGSPGTDHAFSTLLRLDGQSHGVPSFRLMLEARGVRLNAARDAVAGLDAGGSLQIMHALLEGFPDADPLRPAGSGMTLVRTLSVTVDGSGRLLHAYAVNGVPREFGDEGAAWLATLLRRYARRY